MYYQDICSADNETELVFVFKCFVPSRLLHGQLYAEGVVLEPATCSGCRPAPPSQPPKEQ